MNPNESDDFWRSPEGGLRYEEVLDAHYRRFVESLAPSTYKLYESTSFDVVVVGGMGGPGTYMALTKGLSAFILDPPVQAKTRKFFRQELAWPFEGDHLVEGAVSLLIEMGHALLERATWYLEGEIVGGIDFDKHFGAGCTTTGMLVMLEHYLEVDQLLVENHFPGYLVELVPVTPGDIELVRKDIKAFFRACEKGKIHVHDLRRTS